MAYDSSSLTPFSSWATNSPSTFTRNTELNSDGHHSPDGPEDEEFAILPPEGKKCLQDFWDSLPLDGVHCNSTWDTLYCWPSTEAGETVKEACATVFSDVQDLLNYPDAYAFRECGPTGHWLRGGWTNYSQCLQVIELQSGRSAGVVEAVRYITFIGALLSLLALVITIFIFTYFRTLECDRLRVHRNLVVALIVRFVVMLVIAEPFISHRQTMTYRDIDWLCKTLLALRMYAQMASINWMFVEGLFLHSRLTSNIFDSGAPFPLYYTIGWGVPLGFITAWAATMAVKYPITCWKGYGNLDYIWILVAPMVAALLVNLAFLVNIIRIMVTRLRPRDPLVRIPGGAAHEHRRSYQSNINHTSNQTNDNKQSHPEGQQQQQQQQQGQNAQPHILGPQDTEETNLHSHFEVDNDDDDHYQNCTENRDNIKESESMLRNSEHLRRGKEYSFHAINSQSEQSPREQRRTRSQQKDFEHIKSEQISPETAKSRCKRRSNLKKCSNGNGECLEICSIKAEEPIFQCVRLGEYQFHSLERPYQSLRKDHHSSIGIRTPSSSHSIPYSCLAPLSQIHHTHHGSHITSPHHGSQNSAHPDSSSPPHNHPHSLEGKNPYPLLNLEHNTEDFQSSSPHSPHNSSTHDTGEKNITHNKHESPHIPQKHHTRNNSSCSLNEDDSPQLRHHNLHHNRQGTPRHHKIQNQHHTYTMTPATQPSFCYATNRPEFNIRKAIRATLVLFPLLGITNLLFAVNPGDKGDLEGAYMITNALLQSSQGVFVSVLYCFLNTDVQEILKKRWRQYRTQRLGYFSSHHRKNTKSSMLFSSFTQRHRTASSGPQMPMNQLLSRQISSPY